jgi:hypothetical protein
MIGRVLCIVLMLLLWIVRGGMPRSHPHSMPEPAISVNQEK